MPAKLIRNGRVLMALVMFLIFVAMVGVALDYPAQARFMRLVVGLPGIGFTLYELIREVRRALTPTVETESPSGNSGTIVIPDDVSRLIGQESMMVQAETPQMSPLKCESASEFCLAMSRP